MKPTLILLSLLLCSSAYACDSYEDCMKTVTYELRNIKGEPDQNGTYQQVPSQIAILQAIAYKLDEISKKLDNKMEHK